MCVYNGEYFNFKLFYQVLQILEIWYLAPRVPTNLYPKMPTPNLGSDRCLCWCFHANSVQCVDCESVMTNMATLVIVFAVVWSACWAGKLVILPVHRARLVLKTGRSTHQHSHGRAAPTHSRQSSLDACAVWTRRVLWNIWWLFVVKQVGYRIRRWCASAVWPGWGWSPWTRWPWKCYCWWWKSHMKLIFEGQRQRKM